MEAEFSSEFLACLNEYRRKSIIHRVYRAWKKYVNGNNKRYDKACTALEYWNYNTLKKCFNYLKRLRRISEAGGIPYTKGIYLIILAASCFLAPKAIKSYGCRLDKLLSLFKQNNIMMPKVEVLKGLVKSWENHLTEKYFKNLKTRYLNIKAFKTQRVISMKAKCFRYLKNTVNNKKVLKIMKRLMVKNFLRQWKDGIRTQKVDNIQEKLADKFRKKLYLKKCFDVLAEFTRWNKQNSDNMALAKNFYNLNLKMKTLIKLKISSRAERMHKNHKLMEKTFIRKRLLAKTLKGWKAVQNKKRKINEKFEKYQNQKNFLKKQAFMKNWKWAYLTKTKVEYYTRLKLLDKGLRGLQQNVEKKYKIESIARFSESQRKSVAAGHQKDELMDIDNRIVDKIFTLRTETQNKFLTKLFGKWKVFAQNKAVLRRLKYQAELYKDLSYYKQFFSVWREKFDKRTTEAKAHQIATQFSEGGRLRKAFDGLQFYYRQRAMKTVKNYKINERYEVGLMRKFFNTLHTEKRVNDLLCQTYYQRSCEGIMRRCFDALLMYTGQNIWIRKTINGFKKDKEEYLKTKGFYALKKMADANIIKRRSNKLAEIIHTKKLFTKTFLGFKKNQKVQRKFNVITQRKARKTMKTLYLLWKAKFKEERAVSKLSVEQSANKLARIFAAWKKFASQEKATNTMVREFTERRNLVNLTFIWAIWKKYMTISQNKHTLGQALFISYVHNFKKNIFNGWRNFSSRARKEKKILNELTTRKNNEILSQYFGEWFVKNAKYREKDFQSRQYASEKFSEKMQVALRAWLAVSKERAIRRKLLELWKEKSLQTLLGQAFEGWKVHVAEKSTKENLVYVRNQFSALKMLQNVFNALQEWKVKRQRERENYEQIREIAELRVKRETFGTWCDEFKDSAFERIGDELVDKYRKIMCFRLFHKKVHEKKEAKIYSDKLDQFADEVHKRRGFLTFMKNARRLRANRIDLEEREAEFTLYRKQKAFSEFKTVLSPRINAMKSNLKAMKFYILKLYSASFDAWKMSMRHENLNSQRSGFSFAKENRQDDGRSFVRPKVTNLNVRTALMERSASNTVEEEDRQSSSDRDLKSSSESMRLYFQKWTGRSAGASAGMSANKLDILANVLSKVQRRYLEEGFENLTEVSSFEDARPSTVF